MGLKTLLAKYNASGFQVMAFPCNQFGKQKPGSALEIQEFCEKNYGVTFDMFSKVEVNGAGACDFYKHLTKQETKPAGPGKVAWNFEKFLVNAAGDVVARFSHRVKPEAIAEQLGELLG